MTSGAPYVRARGIARQLGLSERTIRRRIADGTLWSVKIGGARLIPEAVLHRLTAGADELEDASVQVRKKKPVAQRITNVS
jgi:excisionase family DNA binding protein